jgi:hypothetical protein
MRASWQDISAIADAIYAEARGDGVRSMRAVGHVVMNRAAIAGVSPAQAAYAEAQFSGLMPGDPNRDVVEKADLSDPAYAKAVQIATEIASKQSVDPTDGATYYHTTTIKPDWSGSQEFEDVGTIGSHQFYKAPEREVRAVTRQAAVDMPARDEAFVTGLQQAVSQVAAAPVDAETGEFVFAEASPRPYDQTEERPDPPSTFMAYAGMTPASAKTERQIDAMTPEGQALLSQTEANLSRMGELGYEVPEQSVVTSGMRDYSTDRRTHPTGGAFDLRTRGLTDDQVRSTALAALGAGAQGLGVFDGNKDRFATHMHVDNVGAWGPDVALGSAVPADIRNTVRGAGVRPTGEKIAEALQAGVVLPDGTLSPDFVTQGTIPREGPRARPEPEAMVADLGAGMPSWAAEGMAAPYAEEEMVAAVPEMDPGQRVTQAWNEMAGDIRTLPRESMIGAMADEMPVDVPAPDYAGDGLATPYAPDERMVRTESMPADIAGRVEQGFGAFGGDIKTLPSPGLMAAQAAPVETVPGYDPLSSPMVPQQAPVAPQYDPLSSPMAPGPIPTARPGGPAPPLTGPNTVAAAPIPAVPAAPVAPVDEEADIVGAVPDPTTATRPDDIGHLTGDYSVAAAGTPIPPDRPERDTFMGNIIGQGFGMVGGGIMAGIPGAMLGRKVGGALGRGASRLGLGDWMDDVVQADPRLEAGIEAGWSSPDGSLNSEWDDKRYWSEISKNGYTNNERNIQLAMSREQRERAAAGQKTWADAFGINQDTSILDAGKDALGRMVSDLAAPIVDPIKENVTTPIREAWEDNVTEPIKTNVTEPIKSAVRGVTDPIRSTVRGVTSAITTPISNTVDAATESIGEATKSVLSDVTSSVSSSNVTPPTDPQRMEAQRTVEKASEQAAEQAAESQSSSSSSDSSSSSSGDSAGSGNPNENGGGGSDEESRNTNGTGGLYSLEMRDKERRRNRGGPVSVTI